MAKIEVSGLGGFIREQRDQAQMSLRQLAKAAEVSDAAAAQVLDAHLGRVDPAADRRRCGAPLGVADA